MKNRISVTLSVLFLVLMGCNKRDIGIKNFNSESWKNDSLACAKYRKEAYQKILDQKEMFMGSSYSKLIDLLGEPNMSKDENDAMQIFYYVETGFQCIDSVEKTPERLSETPVIYFQLDSHKNVRDVGTMIP